MSASTSNPRAIFPHPALLGTVLVAAVVLAYWNSLSAPLLFDDLSAVANNASIRQFSTALSPPADGSATTGRPVVNLSFALNHALGGDAVRGYHALNIAIHAAAALALFGLLRRTRSVAGSLAFAVALLWAVHPLQTESVTCIAQRTESLCGLFYLLTLYGFARGGRWLILSVFACLLGMATKEVMVTAPLMVLLYDRTFVAGSFAAAWRQRRGYYGALAATWLLLAWLVLGAGGTRGSAAGLGLGVSWWSYLLKQCEAIVLYLKLSFWPHPLVVDYGTAVVNSLKEVWWQGPVVLALLAATVWALVRRPALGFMGAWFFVILAPSSSVVPLVSQTMAEHRMYLPLAAVITLVVFGACRWLGVRSLWVMAGLALAAGLATRQRNTVYLGEQAVWEDVLAHRPDNARAHNNLGSVLMEAGRIEEAAGHFQESIRLDPDWSSAHSNLCNALRRLGRAQQAVAPGEEALRLKPDSADAHVNLAAALAELGRPAEAVVHYEEALRLQPGARDVPAVLAAACHELGNQLAAQGNFTAAIVRYRQALTLAPELSTTRNNLANALLVSGQTDEAITLYQQILRQRPDDTAVRENLARALELKR